MNYKKRFNTIVEKIGDRQSIEGISRIYHGTSGYLSISAKGLEITRGCGDEIYKIEFRPECRWENAEDLLERIKEWFDYVEEKVDISIPSEVIVNGRKYKLVVE